MTPDGIYCLPPPKPACRQEQSSVTDSVAHVCLTRLILFLGVMLPSQYLYKWTKFTPGPVDPAVFELPDLCKQLPSTPLQPQQKQQQQDQQGASAGSDAGVGVGRHHQALQAIALLPGNHQEHAGA